MGVWEEGGKRPWLWTLRGGGIGVGVGILVVIFF